MGGEGGDFAPVYEVADYEIDKSRVGRDNDKGDAVNAGDIGDLYYRQILRLCMSNKKPGKSGKEK
ncbi:hypothetical protein BROSI_A1357 [Candidatus Brocadia sinica JPN1]|uniref:Uncharacterized protein n=1 Tax=Candidatus Brocadia sinica JPN1 TaxID=1197129 RepID=A0ABQ0JVU0_9BACT|nr:hypothetical protein BROSI_A1357 [Candidatus Brocadia sinica JPN1]GIK13635.1 MAG: hypothetical protein BroJett002_23420 [Candidatus Brocadia sinica]GJQ16592.1 MAG: hypothetical protein HBSIN01_05510 [Candidatus Brocadia sinica]